MTLHVERKRYVMQQRWRPKAVRARNDVSGEKRATGLPKPKQDEPNDRDSLVVPNSLGRRVVTTNSERMLR
jgi:hypothetical protein